MTRKSPSKPANAWMILAVYVLVVFGSAFGLAAHDELSLGRHPLENLAKTIDEMARPSFLKAWFGDEVVEYRSDDGTLLRTENEKLLEREFLLAIVRALGVTFAIATLGTALAAVLAIPFAICVSKNLNVPGFLAWPAKLVLDSCRAIHTLVFGLFFVGIVGLGPTAGILAIAAHALGSFGKLYSESIETLDLAPLEAIRQVGAGPIQTFVYGVCPAVFPQLVSTNLYIWEFNTRDSTILGIIGAGGLGLLLSEAISLFQWGRLSTLLLVVIAFVALFDWVSRHIRQRMI